MTHATKLRELLAAATCTYADGRCNSSRCPKHGALARAARDALADIDRLTRERDEANARADAAEAAARR